MELCQLLMRKAKASRVERFYWMWVRAETQLLYKSCVKCFDGLCRETHRESRGQGDPLQVSENILLKFKEKKGKVRKQTLASSCVGACLSTRVMYSNYGYGYRDYDYDHIGGLLWSQLFVFMVHRRSSSWQYELEVYYGFKDCMTDNFK